ncbi:hypothetical protein BASA81_003019 [Batrachochytrium salamandrivorans]|nr:hypothetical protein BASA81_003019 [Batrachochytrium salamandrivorans]
MKPSPPSSSSLGSSVTSQAAKFLKDPDAEFSSSITPKLGIFPCTFQTGPPAQNSLKFNILERSKRSAQIFPNHHLFQDTNLQGLDEQKRKQCREALQRWQLRQQQRDREPNSSSKGNGLCRFLDQVNKKEIGGMELEEWLGMFANTSQQSFFEFIETYGCPEPKRFLGRGAGWVSGILDAVCDKKIPNNRAVWLIKYAMLTNLSKDMKMHLAPKGWTEHMLGWLGKLLDTMGKGIDAENRWKRGTSLVRWMFEDGLLSSKSLFDELLKIWRTAFGAINASNATANTATTTTRLSNPQMPTAALSSNKLYSDRVQMLVATELASYVADAMRLGFAKEFYDCATQILPSVSNENIRPLFELSLSLCQLDLDRDTAQREFWAHDRVGLAWELERIKFCLEDEERLGREVWSAVRRNGFAVFSPLACEVLVDWCTSGNGDVLDREERMELVCFAFVLSKHLPMDHLLANCPELLTSLLARKTPQLAPHSPSCFAFCEAMLDCGFEMEAGELVTGLMQIQPPFARVRAVSWLLGKCCNATLHLALLPVMENSLLFKRQLMLADSELRLAIVSRCGAIRQDIESRRLGELLRITSVSPVGGAGNHNTGGATGTMLFMGPPLTPQFPNGGSTNPASGLGGAGGGGQRKRIKQQNALLHGVEFELREDPNNSPPPATNTPSHLSGQASFTPALLHTAGYSGQVARYEFGLHKLGGEALDRILEELRLDSSSAARLLRDFTCCRDTSKERGVILNEMITGGWNLEDAVSFGLVTLEEVLLEWISKRQVPSSPALPLCPSTSNVLVQQQWKQLACFKSPSATLFRLVNHFMLLGKTKSEAFAEMYKSVGREWISQGPGALWQKDTKRFPEELKEMLRPTTNGVDFYAEWRDAWTLARSSWFLHSQDAEMLRVGLDTAQSNDNSELVAANVAAIIKAWDLQDVIGQKLADTTAFPGASNGLLLARLLSLGGPKLDAVCKEVALANAATGNRHLAAGALFHAQIGTLAAEDALVRLATVTDVCDADCWRVAIELLRQASPMHQSDVQSFGVLREAWRLIEISRDSNDGGWYRLVCKALREEPSVTARTRAENLIRLGTDDFVDAWSVLECAHDTLANQTFLRVPPQVGKQPSAALL